MAKNNKDKQTTTSAVKNELEGATLDLSASQPDEEEKAEDEEKPEEEKDEEKSDKEEGDGESDEEEEADESEGEGEGEEPKEAAEQPEQPQPKPKKADAPQTGGTKKTAGSTSTQDKGSSDVNQAAPSTATGTAASANDGAEAAVKDEAEEPSDEEKAKKEKEKEEKAKKRAAKAKAREEEEKAAKAASAAVPATESKPEGNKPAEPEKKVWYKNSANVPWAIAIVAVLGVLLYAAKDYINTAALSSFTSTGTTATATAAKTGISTEQSTATTKSDCQPLDDFVPVTSALLRKYLEQSDLKNFDSKKKLNGPCKGLAKLKCGTKKTVGGNPNIWNITGCQIGPRH